MSTTWARVSFCNEGGELDHRLVRGHEGDDLEAGITEAALEMIREAGHLSIGDTIKVRQHD
jgi:hypothetical protein